ncbi:MAG: hypothetical protein F6K47_26005 [Symploca sp. SIO2E6]|nr:hypothetical protein [Symploca sp. SIO2E6]
MILVAVATSGGLYWWFQMRSRSVADNQSPEAAKTSEAWRNVRLIRTVAQPINPREWVSFLEVSRDRTKLISGLATDNQIKVWDLAQGQILHTFEGSSDSITKVAIDAEGKKIASITDDRAVQLWDLATGQQLQSFTDYSGDVKLIAFGPDGQTLITLTETKSDQNQEQFVKVIEVQQLNNNDNQPAKPLKLGTGKIGALAFNPQEQLLAVNTSETNRVDLWHLGQQKKLTHLFVQFPEIRAIAFSQEGKRLAISGGEGIVEVWDLVGNQSKIGQSPGKWELRHTLTANGGIINTLAFSPDGNTLFTGARDRTVNIWNLNNGDLVRTLTGNSAWVEALAVIPGSQPEEAMLVTGTALGEIQLWQPDSQTPSLSQEVIANISQLRKTRRCQQCNLSGADLRNFALSEVDLQWANLSNANLSQVNLSEANLQSAILFETNLEQAILQQVNLEEANLAKANLKGADITDAKLGGAILTGTIMPNGQVYGSKQQVTETTPSPEEPTPNPG